MLITCFLYSIKIFWCIQYCVQKGIEKMEKNHFVLTKRNNGYWYYWFYKNGKRIFKSTGQKTKSKALEIILERIALNNLANEKEPIYNKDSLTFGEFAQPFWHKETCPIYLDKIQRGGKYGISTLRQNLYHTNKFILPKFAQKRLIDITPIAISEWLRNLPNKYNISNKTANETFNTLSQMLDVATLQGLIAANPTKSVKRLVQTQKQRGCFTLEQIQALFKSSWSNKFYKVACMVSATTGMRIGEILALSKDQIKDGYIVVNQSYSKYDGFKSTKSGKPRIVPITERIKKELYSLPSLSNSLFFAMTQRDKPLNADTLNKALQQQLQAIGIDYKKENLSFHSFRHFFNTRLVANSVNVEHIRAVIGHESERMTENYLHLTAKDLKEIKDIQESILI